jgi:hypothetical protein
MKEFVVKERDCYGEADPQQEPRTAVDDTATPPALDPLRGGT